MWYSRFSALLLKIQFCWAVMSFHVMCISWQSEWQQCPHLQGQQSKRVTVKTEVLCSFEISQTKHPTPHWDISEQLNLLKNVGMSTKVHGVTSQKRRVLIITTNRSSNLTYQSVWNEKLWIPLLVFRHGLLNLINPTVNFTYHKV